jgi:hypothetical protein
MPAIRQWVTTRRAVTAALAIVVILTIALHAAGLLSDSDQLTAYATAVLAVGTVGLAVGAIGTYLEQRDTNRQQAGQLAAAETADMAQVMITRPKGTGPGSSSRLTSATGAAVPSEKSTSGLMSVA